MYSHSWGTQPGRGGGGEVNFTTRPGCYQGLQAGTDCSEKPWFCNTPGLCKSGLWNRKPSGFLCQCFVLKCRSLRHMHSEASSATRSPEKPCGQKKAGCRYCGRAGVTCLGILWGHVGENTWWNPWTRRAESKAASGLVWKLTRNCCSKGLNCWVCLQIRSVTSSDLPDVRSFRAVRDLGK